MSNFRIRIVVLLAFLLIIWQLMASGWRYTSCANKHTLPGTLLYAAIDSSGSYLAAYSNGNKTLLSRDEFGHLPLNRWIGYSSLSKSILYIANDWDSKKCKDIYLLGKLKLVSTRPIKISRDQPITLTDVQSYFAWGFADNKLCQIRGHGRQLSLLEIDDQGKTSRFDLPNLPEKSSISREWQSAAAIHGNSISFISSRNESFLVGIKNHVLKDMPVNCNATPGSCRFLTDNGFEWSPDGRTLAYCSGLTISLYDVRTEKTRRISVWHPIGPMEFLPLPANPSRIFRVAWVPQSNYLLSEVGTYMYGFSYLYLTNVDTGLSCRLPITVDRYRWCWVSMNSIDR